MFTHLVVHVLVDKKENTWTIHLAGIGNYCLGQNGVLFLIPTLPTTPPCIWNPMNSSLEYSKQQEDTKQIGRGIDSPEPLQVLLPRGDGGF